MESFPPLHRLSLSSAWHAPPRAVGAPLSQLRFNGVRVVESDGKTPATCPICFGSLNEDGLLGSPWHGGAPYWISACRNMHLVHKNCLRQWREQGNVTCPECREPALDPSPAPPPAPAAAPPPGAVRRQPAREPGPLRSSARRPVPDELPDDAELEAMVREELDRPVPSLRREREEEEDDQDGRVSRHDRPRTRAFTTTCTSCRKRFRLWVPESDAAIRIEFTCPNCGSKRMVTVPPVLRGG